MASNVRFVPIGDSYTKCEGATKEESWPLLLVSHLVENGVGIEFVANPAKTGWMTGHVIELELPLFEQYHPDFSTLLIGANDWVQEVSVSEFQANVKTIIDRMQKVLSNPKNLILLTIPDFSVTQIGQIFAGEKDIEKGIQEFNQIIFAEGQTRDLPVVDLFPISKGMKDDPSLVSMDGLHPSGKEYALWEKEIFPAALKLLKGI